MAVLPGGLRLRLSLRLALVLQRCKLLASCVDIVDRADDLANLLIVSILAFNFIFKVLLQSLVLQLNAFDIVL